MPAKRPTGRKTAEKTKSPGSTQKMNDELARKLPDDTDQAQEWGERIQIGKAIATAGKSAAAAKKAKTPQKPNSPKKKSVSKRKRG